MSVVGAVERLVRYPVKSLAGDPVAESMFDGHGMHGDRRYAFIDETKKGFARYVTARQIPAMQAYRASYLNLDDSKSELVVTTPEGRRLGWGEELKREIASLAEQPISLLAFNPLQDKLPAVDEAMLLIITDASLRELERLWGRPVDERRFRANVRVKLTDQESRPFAEDGWIGRELRLGSVKLRVDGPCDRCVMVGIDPERYERDDSLFRLLADVRKGRFGVYATVVEPGEAAVGDPVYLHNGSRRG